MSADPTSLAFSAIEGLYLRRLILDLTFCFTFLLIVLIRQYQAMRYTLTFATLPAHLKLNSRTKYEFGEKVVRITNPTQAHFGRKYDNLSPKIVTPLS